VEKTLQNTFFLPGQILVFPVQRLCDGCRNSDCRCVTRSSIGMRRSKISDAEAKEEEEARFGFRRPEGYSGEIFHIQPIFSVKRLSV
jgi:hypothetical protein